MAVTPVSPLTCTGVLLLVHVPLPNCPLLFKPQAQTVPSLFSARLCQYPPAMAVTPLSPPTCTGVLLAVFVPLPNRPSTLRPQAQTVPSLFSARLCKPPPAMAVAPVRKPTPAGPSTCTGVLLLVTVPLPNSPSLLTPQAQTVPSLFSARLCENPTARAVTPLSPLTCTGVL